MMPRLSFAILLVTVSALTLSGCGRRADLDTPSEARWEAEAEAAKAAGQPAPPRPEPRPDRRFILDGLID